MGVHTPLSMLLLDTKDHVMRVLRDDGVYRHIRFGKPGTSMYQFDLVTWPGHLVIDGDIGGYHFARLHDMFEFFRNKVGYINEGYWAQKLRGPVRAKSYSPKLFKQLVFERFRYFCEQDDNPHAELWRAIRAEVLADADVIDDNEAHRRLAEFRYDLIVDRLPEGTAQDFKPQRLRQNSRRYSSTYREHVFEFTDSYEWDLTAYDWHFQVACHAIVWGINRYDEERGEPGEAPSHVTTVNLPEMDVRA